MMTTTGTGRTTAQQPLASGVHVDLLPREVREARQGRRARVVVLVALGVVVVVLAGVSLLARAQVGLAGGDLATAQGQTARVVAQQRQYAGVVAAQSALAAVQAQLDSVTAADIAWFPVLEAVRGAAPAGAVVVGVKADNDAVDGSGGAAPASDPVPGSLTVVGTAADQVTVAAYVDALSALPGFASVVASSATSPTGTGVEFTIDTDLTAAVVGSRFATTPGGR